MTAQDAIRFIAYQAGECRSRDQHEALCLLLPGLMHSYDLRPMTDDEARRFRHWLRQQLQRDREPHRKAA